MIARDLSVLAHAQGFTLWHFRARDGAALGEGFFAPAAGLMEAGDMVLVSGAAAGLLVVEPAAGGIRTRPLSP